MGGRLLGPGDAHKHAQAVASAGGEPHASASW
jgi:hypothetical protein